MMYRCKDCKSKFENFKTITECHGLDRPPYEKIAVCPSCLSQNIEEYTVKHCRYCGARLKRHDGVYCNNECRRNGEKLWKIEAKRRKQLAQSPINITVKKLEEYNKLHNKCYVFNSYISLYVKNAKRHFLKALKSISVFRFIAPYTRFPVL